MNKEKFETLQKEEKGPAGLAGEQELRAESMFDFKYISGLSASPNRKRALFKVSQGNLEDNNYKGSYHILEADGEYYPLTAESESAAVYFDSDDSVLISEARSKKELEMQKKGLNFTSFYRLPLNRAGEAQHAFTLPLCVSHIHALAHKGLYLVVADIDLRSPNLWKLDFKEQEKVLQAEKETAYREHITEIPFYYNGAGMIHNQRTTLFIYDEAKNKLRPMLPETFSLNSVNLSEDNKRIYISAEDFVDKMKITSRLFYYELPEDPEEFTRERTNLWPRLLCLYGNEDYGISACYETSQGLRVLANDYKEYGVNQSDAFYEILLDGKEADTEAVLAAAKDHAALSLRKLKNSEILIGNSTGSDCRLGSSDQAHILDGELYYVTTRRAGTALRKLKSDGEIENLFSSSFSIDGFAILDKNFYFVGMFRQYLQEIYKAEIKTGEIVEPESDYADAIPVEAYASYAAYSDAINSEMSALTRLTRFNGEALENKYVARPIPLKAKSLKAGKNRENPAQSAYSGSDASRPAPTPSNESSEAAPCDGVSAEPNKQGESFPEIEGFVLLPEDYHKSPADRAYPLILDIHGGPRTVYSRIYYHEMQYWVNKGFVVAFCNPRGSDGRGDSFADIRGLYGDVDYDDIMGFLNEVLRRYDKIDHNRLGVTGGSYGGFMTNRIITRTNRFTAAATQRSITNWLSFYGVSDIGFYFATDQNGCDTFSDAGFEQMWRTSPLRYVNEVATPTLIIHAAEDYRCPLEQGYQWFTALKDRNVPCEIVVFHGENHELSRSGKPKARLERLNRITDWFVKYLMPEVKKADEVRPLLPAALIKRRLMIENGRRKALSLPPAKEPYAIIGLPYVDVCEEEAEEACCCQEEGGAEEGCCCEGEGGAEEGCCQEGESREEGPQNE